MRLNSINMFIHSFRVKFWHLMFTLHFILFHSLTPGEHKLLYAAVFISDVLKKKATEILWLISFFTCLLCLKICKSVNHHYCTKTFSQSHVLFLMIISAVNMQNISVGKQQISVGNKNYYQTTSINNDFIAKCGIYCENYWKQSFPSSSKIRAPCCIAVIDA